MTSRQPNFVPRKSKRLQRPRVPSHLTDLVINHVLSLPRDGRDVQYLQDQFLTKFVSAETDSPALRQQRAINKWLATERENEATNDRLMTHIHDGVMILPHVRLRKFIQFAQSLIVDIIGEDVPLNELKCSFSGGASTSRPRTSSLPGFKYTGKADHTSAAYGWFEKILDLSPGWGRNFDLVLNEVEGNVLFTVPKSTTIDRVAAKEPDINMYLQKGVGEFIRRRLAWRGINLNDQSINRRLAREGSISGDLCTIDLSSASDSVTTALVWRLLPPAWFKLLYDLRSPVTMIHGEVHVNEMFSSMGNGFTFELESLLFYALTVTTCYFTGISGRISVYGDDIICPTDAYYFVEHVLKWFGFQVNPDKSFHSRTDLFRESCGGHYYKGYDVTPFYLRKPIETLPELIKLCNQIRKWSGQLFSLNILSDELYPLWVELSKHVPKSLWGGSDLESTSQLVSNDAPKSRIIPVTQVRKFASTGQYVHWLNTTWDRHFRPNNLRVVKSLIGNSNLEIHRILRSFMIAAGYEDAVSTSDPTYTVDGQFKFVPAINCDRRPTKLWLSEV